MPNKPEKPKKKELIEYWEDCTSTGNADDAYDHGMARGEIFGCNKAIADYEAYLPTEDDLFIIIRKQLCDGTVDCENYPECMATFGDEVEVNGCPPSEVAKAVSDRIGRKA